MIAKVVNFASQTYFPIGRINDPFSLAISTIPPEYYPTTSDIVDVALRVQEGRMILICREPEIEAPNMLWYHREVGFSSGCFDSVILEPVMNRNNLLCWHCKTEAPSTVRTIGSRPKPFGLEPFERELVAGFEQKRVETLEQSMGVKHDRFYHHFIFAGESCEVTIINLVTKTGKRLSLNQDGIGILCEDRIP